MDKSERVRAAILEVVKTQMRTGEPPETMATYGRLLSEGYSEEATMKYLGSVVASEIFEVLEKGRSYQHASYVAALEALPNVSAETRFSPNTDIE